MAAIRPFYDEDSPWCQQHGHTGILSGCDLCEALLTGDPAYAEGSELRQRHNLDGTRRRGSSHTGPPPV